MTKLPCPERARKCPTGANPPDRATCSAILTPYHNPLFMSFAYTRVNISISPTGQHHAERDSSVYLAPA
eukprot:CAMPEP_0119106614 /NCGR_PEP_ID=MMETSP1180-20130426/5345_1 /TAXON_ID=3052 ORGANISM="Chlamydomonas cf sp, Strain CCMP681" /NCGR_SAMPLE_ID=MMETSP1180 /ASSEMBLY_ACC=CAM_ASM_000741 /LENGTH=68 /DNA_ID=CAMNT_0007091979 /DNA_START=149 /DNA_END=355 /DNA_ORIENTATION=-